MSVTRLWIGVDAGKEHHHAAALDDTGRVVWSTRVPNDQDAINQLLERAEGHDAVWGIDLLGSETALLRALLAVARQATVYVPGRTVKTMSGTFRGEAKTDARDALVIANTIRMRHDFLTLAPTTNLIAELELLLTHRTGLIEDWVCSINRLRRLLLGISPTLERALTVTNIGVLILLTGYQTPDQIRAAGRDELIAHLRRHRALHVAKLADTALAAAAQQHLTLPGQDIAAGLAAQLATDLLSLHRRLLEIDKTIAAVFDQHPQAKIIRSLPGMGPLVGAEFVVAVGDLSTFNGSDQVAAYAGLAPVPHDSGKRTSNLRRPQRYNRRLRRAMFMSAFTSIRTEGPSRTYYQRKRAQGRHHQQAILALARRRVDVLCALLRDNRCFQPDPPAKAA
jgi:transposase